MEDRIAEGKSGKGGHRSHKVDKHGCSMITNSSQQTGSPQKLLKIGCVISAEAIQGNATDISHMSICTLYT